MTATNGTRRSPDADAANGTGRRPLLETRGLSVDFGGLHALDELDFEVHSGEIVSVIGPNGAGKTTLFNAITATVERSAGDILFEGTSLLGLDPNRVTARGIARTFQNVRLFANMTVLENVMVSQHCRTHQHALRRTVPHARRSGVRRPRSASGPRKSSASSGPGSSATASTSPPSPCPMPTGAAWRSPEPWPPSPS